MLAWRARLRPDPLRRLHLDRLPGRGPARPGRGARAGRTDRPRCPPPAGSSGPGRRPPYAGSRTRSVSRWRRPGSARSRRASLSRAADLEDALDRAVASTDLGVDRVPLWWRLVRLLQLVLVAAPSRGRCGWGCSRSSTSWQCRYRTRRRPRDPRADAAADRRTGRRVGPGGAVAGGQRMGGPVARPQGASPPGGRPSRRWPTAWCCQPIALEVVAHERARSALEVAAAPLPRGADPRGQ